MPRRYPPPRARFYPVSSVDTPAGVMVTVQDLDGPVSVTNDAEAVVRAIYEAYFKPDRPDRKIVIHYYDTDNRLDELMHEKGVFMGFKPVDGIGRAGN